MRNLTRAVLRSQSLVAATCRLGLGGGGEKSPVATGAHSYHFNSRHTLRFSRSSRNNGGGGGAAGGNSSSLLLSPTEASTILRTNESTVDIKSKSAIKFYESNYLGANEPPEDRQAHAKALNSDIYLFGVFDGHGGPYCADTIAQRLFDYIALNFLSTRQLEEKLKLSSATAEKRNTNGSSHFALWSSYETPYADARSSKLRLLHRQSLRAYADELLQAHIMEESMGNTELQVDIGEVLKNAFVKLDEHIGLEALPSPATGMQLDKETMDVAMSGSCACVALLDGRDLYVANSGDARAIIGQENDDGTYSVMRMSHEHNAENVDEVRRLFAEHPNEHMTLFRDGRLLEMLLPLRAFGDIRFKWRSKALKEFTVPIYGHGIIPGNYHTPVITHSHQKPSLFASENFFFPK